MDEPSFRHALGMELEVSFLGNNYLIQGRDWSEADSGSRPHIEMFEPGENFERDYVFRYDGASGKHRKGCA